MSALAEKVVVVTGAGRGLGAAYAHLAAAEGARVLVNDIDGDEAEGVAQAIRLAGGKAEADGSDISDPAGAQAMVDHCLARFGSIDGLCNNAAVFWMAAALDEPAERFERMLRVNLLGTALAGLAAARAMVAQGRGGAILNTVSGAQCGSPGMTSYGASKGGVASLTYGWAGEFAPYGIRVNAISPLAHTRTAISIDPALHRDKPPEEVAPVACFLLSDLASEITGQVVFVSGAEIALVSHPGVVEPSACVGHRSIASVAELFAQDLGRRQLPVGRARQRVTIVSASEQFDVRH